MPQLSAPQSLPLGNSIQIKNGSNRKIESAGRTLSSVLSPQPPYNTKKLLWRREMSKYLDISVNSVESEYVKIKNML